MILGDIETKEADRKEWLFYGCILLFMTIYIASLFKYLDHWREIRVVSEAIIMIVNFAMLWFLRSKLKVLGRHGFKQAIESVKKQFAVFLASYVVLVVIDVFIWVDVDLLEQFEFLMPIIFLKQTMFLIPVCYVLYVHLTTLR